MSYEADPAWVAKNEERAKQRRLETLEREHADAATLVANLQQSLKIAREHASKAHIGLIREREIRAAEGLFGHLAGARVLGVDMDCFVVELTGGQQLVIRPLSRDGKPGELYTYFSRPWRDEFQHHYPAGKLTGMTIEEGSCLYEDGQMRPTLRLTGGEEGDPLRCAIYPPGDFNGHGGTPGSFEMQPNGALKSAAN